MTSRGLSLLAEACAALAAEQLENVSDAHIGENIAAIHHGVALLEAQRSRNIRIFDTRAAFADRASSMVGWLRRVCRVTGPAAAALVEVARRLPSLPAAERAFERGEMGLHHAHVMTRLIDDVGVEAVRKGEQILVESAKAYDAATVRNVARNIREYVDAQGAQIDADAQHRRRRLDVRTTLDGVVYLEGRLHGDDGATVLAALDSLMAPVGGDERSASQRRADAWTEICRRQLDGGELPRRGGQRPHLSLTVSVDKLRGDGSAPPAHLDWVGSITAEAARRLTCDCLVTTVVVDAKGQPVIIGPEVPVVPACLRRALVIRDGGCVYPGCDARPQWCDAHHLVHRIDGGETTAANLGLLCRRCHRRIHQRGMVLRRTQDGGWEVVDGRRRVIRRDPWPPPSLRELIAGTPLVTAIFGAVPRAISSRAT